jgi:hypothetical protein
MIVLRSWNGLGIIWGIFMTLMRSKTILSRRKLTLDSKKKKNCWFQRIFSQISGMPIWEWIKLHQDQFQPAIHHHQTKGNCNIYKALIHSNNPRALINSNSLNWLKFMRPMSKQFSSLLIKARHNFTTVTCYWTTVWVLRLIRTCLTGACRTAGITSKRHRGKEGKNIIWSYWRIWMRIKMMGISIWRIHLGNRRRESSSNPRSI